MNTKLLKQKILDLAIRGKLTQQLKSDGTAADLLKQISEQKRESSSTLSSPRRRGSPSAQSEKTIIPLDKSEAPFEIPANWEWVRLGDLMSKVGAGSTPTGGRNIYETSGVKFIRSQNVYNEGLRLDDVVYINESIHKQKQNSKVVGNDLLLNITGASIGRCAIVPDDFDEANVNQHVLILRLINFKLLKYVHLAITSQFVFRQIMGAQVGGTKEGLSAERAKELQIPLPPLTEQQRIVEKIQEAFAEIDSIENNKELLKNHIKQARQKILDLAIHGKLVPQNKSDEPASVLLERITRDNPHYEKLTDVPFEIPDSWEWVKLGDVCKPIKRGKSPKYIEQSNVLVFAQKCNQKDGPVLLEKALYLDESTLNKYPKEEFLQKGDVVINSTGTGTLGRVGYFNVDLPQNIKGVVPDSHVTTIRSVYVNPYYLYCFLKNKQTYLEENGEGSTNQKELKPHTIYDLEFPLPPLAEQKRIVDRIEEIFASLDEISLHLV